MAKYVSIANELRDLIQNGEYQNLQKIPDVKTLSLQYEVSPVTIKRAVDILVSEGLVFKKQGSGTYVNINKSTNSLLETTNLTSPTSLTHQHGDDTVTTKVLEFDIIKASEYIANSLMIDKDEFVYKVIRVRYINDRPACVENNYFPINVMIGLDKEAIQGSIYDYTTRVLKLKPKSYHKYIYSRPSNDIEIEELNLKRDEPVSIVEQVAFLDNGIPYEYSVVCHRFDEFKYKTIVNL